MEEKNVSPDILTLMDEDGNEHKFEVVDTTEIEGNRYVGLIPAMEDGVELEDEDSELIVLKVVKDEGQEFLEAIEDESEFDRIAKIFMEHLSEYYDIIEED